MYQSVEVLALIDDDNRIYYTEDKNFAANDREAINQALSDYANLLLSAQVSGYQIIKIKKDVTPIDDELMTAIDEKINELGGNPR